MSALTDTVSDDATNAAKIVMVRNGRIASGSFPRFTPGAAQGRSRSVLAASSAPKGTGGVIEPCGSTRRRAR